MLTAEHAMYFDQSGSSDHKM